MVGMRIIIVMLVMGVLVTRGLWTIQKCRYKYFLTSRKPKPRSYIIGSLTIGILLIITGTVELVVDSNTYETTVMTAKYEWSEKEQIYRILEQKDVEIETIFTTQVLEPEMFEYTTYQRNPIADRWNYDFFQSQKESNAKRRYKIYVPEGYLFE